MKLLKLKLFLLFVYSLFTFSCVSQTLIRDEDYNPTFRTLSKQETASEALLVFPKKEENGFITTFEKSWIKFWTSNEKFSPDEIKIVQKLSDQIESRKFVSISHEASVFLVGESEDGYIPSEHEIVSLHLFLAMLYLDTNDLNSAHVELKRAIEYLANNPDGKETTFDDAAIRVWLASLWKAIGDSDTANVDLRKAMEVSGNKEIQKLIDSRKPKIHLLMTGMGPKTVWSSTGINFTFEYSVLPKDVNDKDFIFLTNNWYNWHQKRNTSIRDRLISSHYMMNALGNKTSRISQKGVGFAVSGVMYGLALGVFVGATYVGIQSGNPEVAKNAIYLGTLLGAVFVSAAQDVNDQINLNIEKSKQEEAESLKVYRMVRFLPSQIQYIDENLNKSFKESSLKGFRKTIGTLNNQVEFIWNPY